MASSNSTDQGFAGSSSYSGTPAKKARSESPPPSKSPIERSTVDLSYKMGDLFKAICLEIAKAATSSEIERNVDELNRFLIAVNFATEVLEKIRGLIKEMERTDDGSVGSGTYESPTQLQNAKVSPSKKSRNKSTSSSAIVIAAFLTSIGQFFGIAMNEITVCAKARPAESIDPAKKERLKRLSSHTEDHLVDAIFNRQKIEKAIAQIDPNYKPKPNLVQSDTENAIIKMVREKPSTLEPIIIALKANGYLPEN